ncbi:hypothetical protein QBC41DRAFT_306177 [Cercophora samala]|uniref:Uncharacterized protein n=1 Tax=Cercophora samala TaxID=330535 RepID=A0AA39Z750_9PEZI|nr:hypothetical protein QBC41DRAFT_306177 [Cercophora samala]
MEEDQELYDRIANCLEDSVFDSLKRRFLPSSLLEELMTTEAIQLALSDEDDDGQQLPDLADLVRFIEDKARKVFATTQRVFKGPEKLRRAMRRFQAAGFGDKDLPVARPGSGKQMANSHVLLQFNAPGDRKTLWTMTTIQEFFDSQWSLMAPVFETATST